MRARDQARAVLGVVRDAMVEIEQPALLALCCLLADGHLLIEDVPGVGKTTLARVVARAIGGHDARIQCTGDLSAEDVVGRLIPSDGFRDETFERGPDLRQRRRLRRVQPRDPAALQSALLAAMEERVVTAGKQRHALPAPVLRGGHDEPARQRGDLRARLRAARSFRDSHRPRVRVGAWRGRPDRSVLGVRRDRRDRPDHRTRRSGEAAASRGARTRARACEGLPGRPRPRHPRPSGRPRRGVAARDPHDVPLLPGADDAATTIPR